MLQRDETIAVFPDGQATVSGFKFMVPPQAMAAHPALSTGATICRSTSNGADATSGMAMRYAMSFLGSRYSEKQISVPPGQYLVVVLCRFAGSEPAHAGAPLRARSTTFFNPISRS